MSRQSHIAASHKPDPALVEALSGLNADADLTIVRKTRRAVREATEELREERRRRRRNAGLALTLLIGFVTLLTPALWNGADELFGGEHWTDLPTMTTLLGLTLFSAIVAALVAGWRNQQPVRHDRRNF